jgi:hypothetical protein
MTPNVKSNDGWHAEKTRDKAKQEVKSQQRRDVTADNTTLNEIRARIDRATDRPDYARQIAVAVRPENGRKQWETTFRLTRHAALEDVRVNIEALETVNEWLEYERAIWDADHNVIFLKPVPDATLRQARELLAWARERERMLAELEFSTESSGSFVPSQGAAIEFLFERVGLRHDEIGLLYLYLDFHSDSAALCREAFLNGELLAFPEPLGIDAVEPYKRRAITRLSVYRGMMTPEERAKLVRNVEEDGGPT